MNRGQPGNEEPLASAGATVFFLVSPSRTACLEPGTYIVGRALDSDIPLADDPLVSRRHARLTVRQDSVDIEDLGSSNGTWVGAELVQHALTVRSDVVVTIGEQKLELRRAPAPRRREATTARDVQAPDPDADIFEVDGPTQEFDPATRVERKAREALDAGRLDEASRLLQPTMAFVDYSGRALPPDSLNALSVAVLRLALARAASGSVDWVARQHMRARALMSSETLELLAQTVQSVSEVDRRSFAAYADQLRSQRRGSALQEAGRLDRILKLADVMLVSSSTSTGRR